MNEHPTLSELRTFWGGGLAAGRSREVVRHLLERCERCGARLSPDLKALFGFPVGLQDLRDSEDAYDAVLDRVFAVVAEKAQRPGGRIEWIRETLAAPPRQRRVVPSRAGGPPGFEALLDRCRGLRYDDPIRMVDLARFGAFLADRLEPRQYGPKRVADLRCQAWTELANAFRVADRLREAETALETAAEAYLAGSGGEAAGVRLLDVQASVDADRRRFGEALKSLDVLYSIHWRNGDPHMAGRALLAKGLYSDYAGDSQQAVDLLRQGLALVDRGREPGLVFGGVHNLGRALTACGRYEEARELLQANRALDPGGQVNRLKVRWLEGEIDAGIGDLDAAVEALTEVCQGFEEIGLAYKAALASLELGAVHLRQGRPELARLRALEAVQVFTNLGVGREVMASVLVVREAFERRIATAALLDSVVARLSQLEREQG